MQKDNKHTNETDAFSQQVKQKLENHQIPVDEAVWEGIEKQLAPAPKRRIAAWYYWVGSGVAAALALMLLLRPVNKPDNEQNLAKISKNLNDEKKPAVASVENPASFTETQPNDEKVHQTVSAESKKSAGLLSKKRILLAENGESKSAVSKESNVATTGSKAGLTKISDEDQPVIAENQTEKTTVSQSSETVKSTEGKSTTKITSLPDLSDYPEMPAEKPAKKKKENMLLAAALGSGGGLPSLSKADNNYYYASPNSDIATGTLNEKLSTVNSYMLSANDYSEIRHLAPVTFTLAMEIPLNTTWSLQTGLMYTYMESRFKKPGNTSYNGNLKLHYLGIPLNVMAKLWNKNHWTIYLSGGAAMEKGLRSVYSQEIDYGSAVYDTKVVSKIDGLQWSVNGAVGINYTIQKNLSLFFEPKVSYYLDNNQPMSARTEQPFTVGLNGGLRIGL